MKKLSIIIFFFALNAFAQHDESRINKFRKDSKIDSQDKVVFNLLEEFYLQALQSDSGELNPNIPEKINDIYFNKKTKNKHLLLMFMAYQDHITKTLAVGKKSNVKFQVELMNDLEYEFKNIFNKIPAIIYIYRFEALDLNGQNEEAAKTIDEGLAEYPNSIPLKVYKFQITKDEILKADLIKNHSSHWMVQQFEIK